MQQSFKFGHSVVTADGYDAGTLHHVVIDEPTRAITALAVQRYLLESGNLLKPGGWEASRDKVLPIAVVTGADEDAVRISLTREEFLALPPYVVGDIPEPESGWTPPPEFRAEDVAMRAGSLLGGGLYDPPHDEVENRGPNDRHLSDGSAVWRREPHTHLGDVDRVLMDDTTNTATALVVKSGVFFKHETVLPMRYVVDLLDDLVHVDIPEAEWERLEEYHAEE